MIEDPLLLVILIISVVLFLITMFLQFIDSRDKRKRILGYRVKGIKSFLFITSLIFGLLYILFSYIKDINSSLETLKRYYYVDSMENIHFDTTLQAINKTLALQLTTIDTAKSILNRQTTELRNQNITIETNNRLFSFISGKNRYPYVDVKVVTGTEESEIVFVVQNKFNQPLNNVKVQIFNYDILDSLKQLIPNNEFAIKLEYYQKSLIVDFKEDEILKQQFVALVDKYPFKSGRLLIFLKTRDEVLVQKMVIVRNNNEVYVGYSIHDKHGKQIRRVIDQKMEKEIYKEIVHKLGTIPFTINYQLKY